MKAWSSSGNFIKGGSVKVPCTKVAQLGQESCATFNVAVQLGQEVGNLGFCITLSNNVTANINKINILFNKIKK